MSIEDGILLPQLVYYSSSIPEILPYPSLLYHNLVNTFNMESLFFQLLSDSFNELPLGLGR